MANFPLLLFAWGLFWLVTINVPPGPKEIQTAYRLNFMNGVISSIAALLALLNVIDDSIATASTISYFFIDFVNILLNDHYYKVKSYQTPIARKVEYFHHILCFGVGIFSEFHYKDVCTLERNPFIYLLLAEISTPFLIAWRATGSTLMGLIFVVLFVTVRLLYHGIYVVPDCIRHCPLVGMGCGLPYLFMNFYFFYMIVQKLLRKTKSSKKVE